MHFSTLELPALIKADDYHEFDYIQGYLRQLGAKKVKIEEIGFDAPMYVAIVYQHKDKDYHRLIKECEENGISES
jgi:hypothetical protein